MIAGIVRQHDRDRYLACLFAPDDRRPALHALYAFACEIARIAPGVSDASIGLIRQQWWLDTVAAIYDNGGAADHPVAQALAQTILTHKLPRAAIEALVTAREFDLYDDPMPDIDSLETYLGHTQSALMQLAAIVLAGDAAVQVALAAGFAGVAYGIGRLLATHAPARFIPCDWLEGQGERDARLRLATHAQIRLKQARAALSGSPAEALPALLPACLTTLDVAGGASQFRRQLTMWWSARHNRI